MTSLSPSQHRAPRSLGEDAPAAGTAHAKAILFGEHAAVYGAPAVAIPLHALTATAEVSPLPEGRLVLDSELYSGDAADAPQRILPLSTAARAALALSDRPDLGLHLRLRSTIPYERGLGSSAAVAAAVARAVAALTRTELSAEAVHDVIMQAEHIAHGRSSGLDGRAVASDAPIRFQGGAATAIRVGAPFTFVLADSGHAGSTSVAVGAVRELREAFPVRVDGLIARLAALSEDSLGFLAGGAASDLGAAMFEAHRLLTELEVSDPSLERLVAAAESAGALGAKLTGGGRGGCVIALARSAEHAPALADALESAGAARTWQTTVETA